MKGRCGRCGDVKPLAKDGPYKRMLCEPCAEEKEREEDDVGDHDERDPMLEQFGDFHD